MSKEIKTFGNIQIEKSKFHLRKNLILLNDVHIVNILTSSTASTVSTDAKNYIYFIGYNNDNYKMKPLHIMLPKSSAYVKGYDSEFVHYR